MKDKILALLITQFTGMRKDGLAQLARSLSLQATTEEEAGTLVEKLTEAQVKDFIKDYRVSVDKEVSEANKTFESNLKRKFNLEAEPTEPTEPKPEANDIAAVIEAAITKAVRPIQEKLSGFEGLQTNQSRLQTLENSLKNVPQSYKAKVLKDFGRMAFNDEQAFNEYLTETKTDIAEFSQELADQGIGQQGKPIFGQTNQDGISSGVAQYIESQSKPENSLGGKEI